MEKAQNMFVNEQGKTHEENSSNEYFINPIPTKSNWEMNNSNSLMDQNDGFESALSSMVSSPTATNNGGGENNNIIVLRELIGRLGSICNSYSSSSSSSSSSGPAPINNNNYTYNTSGNTSCYSTPLNSPPKLINNNKNLSSMLMMMENGGNMQQHYFPNSLPPNFSTDPAFAQRAATFSSFANTTTNNTNTLLSVHNPLQEAAGISASDTKFSSSRILRSELIIQCDSMDNSPSVSDHHQHILPPPPGINSRKRKSIIPRKDTPAPAPAAKDKDANAVGASSSGKRSKSDEESSKDKNIKSNNNNNKRESSKDDNDDDDNSTKDYIHVRARRGQATDAHSLAERVRREKISERMKLLQDLVPGCNKVTGKAVMLDEIINYVQSLQRQVEFLSMKLATVNPRMDLNMEAALMSKDMFQPRHNIYPPSDTYPFQSQPNLHTNGTQAPNNFNAPIDNFSEPASQMSTFWEDDLHSIVQMGFGQHQTQDFHGTVQMKVEL